MRDLSSPRPAQRPLQRALGVLARGGVREELVEGVDDVGAEGVLHLDGDLRRERVRGAVDG